jgi:cytochrome c oxidase cbb3-type subunit 2
MRPYTPLEPSGRDIHPRGLPCSQPDDPFARDEVERWAIIAWLRKACTTILPMGSERQGRLSVGGNIPDERHVAHMHDLRSVVPESIMPGYPFRPQRVSTIGHAERLKTCEVGVPHTDDMIANAKSDLSGSLIPRLKASRSSPALSERRSVIDGDPSHVSGSRRDCSSAMLGTLVDFAT